MKTRSHPLKSFLGILLLAALTAVACGPSLSTVSTEEAAANAPVPAPAAGDVEAGSVDLAPLVPSPISSDTALGGHQYGATIEEYGAALRGFGANGESDNDDDSGAAVVNSDYTAIEWEDLIPAGFSERDLMDRFEDRLDAAEPGSDEANVIYEEMRSEWNPDAVNDGLDGQKIRLAGFVAPLTFENEIVTEFLLVPTFGACIHVPPPPPNQTILVTLDESDGLPFDDAWGAVWVEGTLTLESASTELAEASYSISNGTSGVYSDF